MAKKHSSKTATEKALSNSEPRIQVFSGWQGINIKEAPLSWEPQEVRRWPSNQSDLKPNYLVLQNNLVTTDNQSIETRNDSEILATVPSGYTFTGISCLYHRWLFAVMEKNGVQCIKCHDINFDTVGTWLNVNVKDAETQSEASEFMPANYNITEIGYYQKQFIAMTLHPTDAADDDPSEFVGEIFTGKMNIVEDPYQQTRDTLQMDTLESAAYVADPNPATDLPTIAKAGDIAINATGESAVTRLGFTYVYTNKFGTTKPPVDSNNNPQFTYVTCNHMPLEFSSARYLKISGPKANYASGVDIYMIMDDNTDEIFIGHVDFDLSTPSIWTYNYLGAMSNIAQWTNSSLTLPDENTTKGVPASYFSHHDSRMYFWGDPANPYRVYIGGNPGNELSIATGVGGAYIDIEPGSGIVPHGTEKWKTTQGQSIVTVPCGNANTNQVKRFNIVETNTVVTNEISDKDYMYEEVSNVIGCNSRWGHGVFGDGLYCVSRYGLMVTTMQMEYTAQMRTQSVSDVIQPVFTDRLGTRVHNARMVHIDNVAYIILAEKPSINEKEAEEEAYSLDIVILCYDLNAKSWYTFTYDGTDKKILHALPIDSEDHVEGLGIVTESEIRLIPTTGMQEEVPPQFNVLMETGELSTKIPKQQWQYVSQLEFRFDYVITDPNDTDPPYILVEGIDYYGRVFKIKKEINKNRKPGVMRDYVEWIHIDRMVESYHVKIYGKVRFRLVSINSRLFTQSNKIGVQYGYDSLNMHFDHHDKEGLDHHYIEDYNSLRRAIVT